MEREGKQPFGGWMVRKRMIFGKRGRDRGSYPKASARSVILKVISESFTNEENQRCNFSQITSDLLVGRRAISLFRVGFYV